MTSPYLQSVRSQQALVRSVEPNLQAFRLYFPEAHHIDNQIVEHFDTDKCPNRYQGAEKRWNLAMVDSVNRFPLGNVVKDAGPAGLELVTIYLFKAASPEKCYSGQEASESELRYLVVSLPDQVLRQWVGGSDKRVLICEDDLCATDMKALESLYRQYHEQYQEFLLYSECSGIDNRNKVRLRAKTRPKPETQLPDACPQHDLDVKLKRTRARVEALDQRLFGAQTIQLVHSNSL